MCHLYDWICDWWSCPLLALYAYLSYRMHRWLVNAKFHVSFVYGTSGRRLTCHIWNELTFSYCGPGWWKKHWHRWWRKIGSCQNARFNNKHVWMFSNKVLRDYQRFDLTIVFILQSIIKEFLGVQCLGIFFLFILDKQRWINFRGYLQFDPIPEKKSMFFAFSSKSEKFRNSAVFWRLDQIEEYFSTSNEISTFQNIIADLIPTSLLNQYGEELWRKPKVMDQTILNS